MSEHYHTESTASANVRLIGENGADIQLTVRTGADIADVTGVLDVMAQAMVYAREKYHLAPAQARNGKVAAHTNGNGHVSCEAPVCQYHGAMKRSTKFSGWFCPSKMGDGNYCREQVKD